MILPESSAALLTMAQAMDRRSAERYRELASVFEMSCNRDTAQAFAELAGIEEDRAGELAVSPAQFPASLDWFDDCPEISDPDSVHYLMLPWHAFDLARRLEGRCRVHFLAVAEAAEDRDMRAAALSLAEREERHIQEITARRNACPAPHSGWWDDQDGPNWDAD